MLGFVLGIPQNPVKLPSREHLVQFRLPKSHEAAVRDVVRPPLVSSTVPNITISKTTASKPSLEFYSGNGEARRVTIEQLPFRIGRAESADLRIESAEVSREHAEITERNGMWLVRDLGSTNGTQVNGKPVKESLLADGDVLRVAETELTFIASAASQFQRMVTQPVQSKKTPVTPTSLPATIVANRKMMEATLWQAIPIRLLTICSLRLGTAEAFVAMPAAPSKGTSEVDQTHQIGERYREIERMRAVDAASERAESGRLFLTVSAAEAESPHRLYASLKQLQEIMPSDWELGVTLSLPIDVDLLRIDEVYRQARDHGLLVAFDEFQGNGGQVMHLQSLLPDYIILASNMTKDVASNRQPLRRLDSLVAACDELGIKPVLPLTHSQHAVALFQEIGFDLILQPANQRLASAVAQLNGV